MYLEKSSMDKAGFRIVNNVTVGVNVSLSVEGHTFTGCIVDTYSSFETNKREILIETETSELIAVFVNRISEHKETGEHYVCDSYLISEDNESMNWIGLLTRIEFTD
jgi:hypothetical protein